MEMYFLLIYAFQFGGGDVTFFFPGWYPNCVKFDPAVLSFFKKSWVAELIEIGGVVDYAKGVKIFVFFWWRHKKHTEFGRPEELAYQEEHTEKEGAPQKRNGLCMTNSFKIL